MKYTIALSILACLVIFAACSPAEGNRRGHEFMPDMTHTTGYEANLYDYYYYNRWGSKEEYKSYVMPRLTVPGTVARGQISLAYAADDAARENASHGFDGSSPGAVAFSPNGSVPYYYTDTEEERIRATREITKNPFPITEASLEHGMELYNIYCGICHGQNGDGQGYLVREADPAKGIVAGVYPAAPANLLQDTFINTSPGLIYHAIMYGKNVMGPYADKLSYKERWEVIHYIRSLQAKSKKLDYTASTNALNAEATPWAMIEPTINRNTTGMPTDTLHGDRRESRQNELH